MLLNRLNENRRKIWDKTVESVDFTHSSRKAWNVLKKLGTNSTNSEKVVTNVTADQVATKLKSSSKVKMDKSWSRKVKKTV